MRVLVAHHGFDAAPERGRKRIAYARPSLRSADFPVFLTASRLLRVHKTICSIAAKASLSSRKRFAASARHDRRTA